MSSFRTILTESNMDLVMYVVREKDCNPSQAMNMLLENPKLLIEARSFLDGKTKGKIHPKNINKQQVSSYIAPVGIGIHWRGVK